MPVFQFDPKALERETSIHEEFRSTYGRGSRGTIDWYDMREGKNVIRVIPPISERMLPWFIRYRHMFMPPDGKTKHTCVRFTHPEFGIQCPICAALDALVKEKYNIERWLPKETYHYYVVDRFDPLVIEDPSAPPSAVKIKCARLPWSVHDLIYKKLKDFQKYGRVLNLEDGHDIEFEAKNVKGDQRVRYSGTQFILDQSPVYIDQGLVTKSIDALTPLETFLGLPDPNRKPKIIGDPKEEESVAKARARFNEVMAQQQASAQSLIAYVRQSQQKGTNMVPSAGIPAQVTTPTSSPIDTSQLKVLQCDKTPRNPRGLVRDPKSSSVPENAFECFGCHSSDDPVCMICPNDAMCSHEPSIASIPVTTK